MRKYPPPYGDGQVSSSRRDVDCDTDARNSSKPTRVNKIIEHMFALGLLPEKACVPRVLSGAASSRHITPKQETKCECR